MNLLMVLREKLILRVKQASIFAGGGWRGSGIAFLVFVA